MTRATITPDAIVSAARSWLGTPYHHQAAVKGVGCDCLGLVRGVYEELYGRPAETPPPYSRDWAEAASAETMLEAAARHLVPIGLREARAGDVVIFRLRPGAMAKHAAILSAGSLRPGNAGVSECRMIHAMEGALACEVHINSWWRRRMAAAFRFPDKKRAFTASDHLIRSEPSWRATTSRRRHPDVQPLPQS
jgi:NlpC/P60 family putative phage cell wall peptidase